HRVDVAHDRYDPGLGLGSGPARALRDRVDLRHVKRERAAAAGEADQTDLAAQQARDLAADGESQARSAVLAARASVGLLERLEDDLLFVGGNADPGVAHGD